MRTVEEWFAAYGESHQNDTNKLIHWICIPAIMISLLGLLRAIPITIPGMPYINAATIFIVACLVFYTRLSWQLAMGMLLIVVGFLAIVEALAQPTLPPIWLTSIVIFVVAWIFQFIGHKIEGKKPSFLQDLQFLLIGPLWLLGFIYRRLGIAY